MQKELMQQELEIEKREEIKREKEKKEKNKKSLWFIIICIAAVSLFGAGYIMSNQGGLKGEALDSFNSAVNNGNIEELCGYFELDLNNAQKRKLDKAVDTYVNELIERINNGSVTIQKGYNNLLFIAEKGGKVTKQLKEAQSIISYEKQLAQGYEKYLSGDIDAAANTFKSLKANIEKEFPGEMYLKKKVDERLYQAQISTASKKIKAQDFEGAKELAIELKKEYPDDARVENLIFSTTDLVPYDGEVQHIFFHPLIAYTERAFHGRNDPAGQDNFMVTVSEFNKTIQQLYDGGFILIDINDLYEASFDENGGTVSVTKKTLYLPKEKKPLILSVDDINYYEYMKLDGQVFKLVLDENGDVITYSVDMEGKDCYSKENEIVPLLDTFVRQHPDFSMNWAKGCLAVTGFDGILGYNTDELDNAGYEQEKADAMAVAERLKETGWVFASHSQGHRHSSKISLDLFKNDTDRWVREVLPLIGPTSVYIYPFGEAVPVDGPKFDYMKEKGFAMFCTVSSNSKLNWGSDFVIQGRRAIDGISYRDKRLYDILDVPSIIDPVRPSYAAWHEWAVRNKIISK